MTNGAGLDEPNGEGAGDGGKNGASHRGASQNGAAHNGAGHNGAAHNGAAETERRRTSIEQQRTAGGVQQRRNCARNARHAGLQLAQRTG